MLWVKNNTGNNSDLNENSDLKFCAGRFEKQLHHCQQDELGKVQIVKTQSKDTHNKQGINRSSTYKSLGCALLLLMWICKNSQFSTFQVVFSLVPGLWIKR